MEGLVYVYSLKKSEQFLDDSNDHCERLNFMMIMKGIVEEGRTKNLKIFKK